MIGLRGVALLILVAAIAPAAGATAGIGYVNFQRLLRDAPQRAASLKLLNESFATQRTKIEQDEASFKARRKELLSLGPETNPLERADASEKLQKSRRTLREDRQSYETAMGLRRAQLTANLRRIIHREIATYAQKHGLELVLGSRVAFAGATIDITDAVLSRLRSAYAAAKAEGGKRP